MRLISTLRVAIAVLLAGLAPTISSQPRDSDDPPRPSVSDPVSGGHRITAEWICDESSDASARLVVVYGSSKSSRSSVQSITMFGKAAPNYLLAEVNNLVSGKYITDSFGACSDGGAYLELFLSDPAMADNNDQVSSNVVVVADSTGKMSIRRH